MAWWTPIRGMLSRIRGTEAPGSAPFEYGGESEAGTHVTEQNAMRLATVQACVRVLSEDVAALHMHLYRRTKDGGKERAEDHPLWGLVHDAPNDEMTPFAFKQAIMMNLLLDGNAFILKEYSRGGTVRALWPVMSDRVEVTRDSEGNLAYFVNGIPCPREMMLHIPGLSYDGVKGLSPISYARESIGLSIAAEKYGAKFFKNGSHLGGTITFAGKMSDEVFERTRKQFNQMYRGLQNAHGVAIIEEGGKFEKLGISPEDAQFLETRKYQRTEIAAIFRVPLHMIGDLEHATFSNIEHQDISYLQRSLVPWLERIEQAIVKSMLTPEERREMILEFATENFLRGDTISRYQAYAIGIQNGFLAPNEIRVLENRNPMEGGDDIMLPLNMTQAGSKVSGEDVAGNEGRTLPDFMRAVMRE